MCLCQALRCTHVLSEYEVCQRLRHLSMAFKKQCMLSTEVCAARSTSCQWR